MYTTIAVAAVAILVIIAVIIFIATRFGKSKISDKEYREMSKKTRSMMTTIDPLTGLPYVNSEKPDYIEYIDERFVDNKKEDEDTGKLKH